MPEANTVSRSPSLRMFRKHTGRFPGYKFAFDAADLFIVVFFLTLIIR